MKLFVKFFFTLSLVGCASIGFVKDYKSDKFYENVTISDENLLKAIEKNAPEIYAQIVKDAKDDLLKSFWGESLNFDSGAKQEILAKNQILSLANYFNVFYNEEKKSIHAGIMHSYAYLFSTLQTPYGFKRSRWTSPDISIGLELNDGSLTANPNEGTLLSNLTFFMGKIAFKTKEQLEKLDKLENVSSEIKKFQFKKLEIVELEEKITNSSSAPFILRTYLVRFLNTKNLNNQFALIYGIENTNNKEIKLITMFPINRDSYLKTIDSNLLGVNRPILIRYNAFIGQTKDDRFSGDRVISNR